MQYDFSLNHFELFGLPVRFALDPEVLADRWRQLQAQVHPDRFAHLSDAERRLSLQWATRVNEAYETLRDAVARGRYFLSLQGVDTQEETNTAMPADFLMRQMELREAIDDARAAHDADTLDRLLADLRRDARVETAALAAALDERGDWAQAAAQVRKLRFLDRLRLEIRAAIESLEE